MSNTTLNEQHQVALAGLKLNTTKLMSFTQSQWTWLNPKQNRLRINELIRELVSYYKALDRAWLSSCSNDIDAARFAIFSALQASAESPEEQGRLIVQEMHSRLKSFDAVLEELGIGEVPAYVMPLSEAVLPPAPEPMPIHELKPQSPSFWASCKSFFSGIWSALTSFFSMFIPAKPDQTVAIIVHKPTPPVLSSSVSVNNTGGSVIQHKRNADKHEHERLKKALDTGIEWPVLTPSHKKPREPGVPITQEYRNKQ